MMYVSGLRGLTAAEGTTVCSTCYDGIQLFHSFVKSITKQSITGIIIMLI